MTEGRRPRRSWHRARRELGQVVDHGVEAVDLAGDLRGGRALGDGSGLDVLGQQADTGKGVREVMESHPIISRRSDSSRASRSRSACSRCNLASMRRPRLARKRPQRRAIRRTREQDEDQVARVLLQSIERLAANATPAASAATTTLGSPGRSRRVFPRSHGDDGHTEQGHGARHAGRE